MKSILVVEDDNEMRAALELALGLQHQVTTARDGAEALDILRKGFRPDIIFCDLQMPTMDGQTFCLERQRDRELQTIPVVLLTGEVFGAQVAKDVGASGFLAKPTSLSVLLTTVDELTLESEVRP